MLRVPAQAAVGGDLRDQLGIDHGEVVGEGVDERVVADLVDDTGQAAAGLERHVAGCRGEYLALGAGDAQAVEDIVVDGVARHPVQMEIGGDALGELEKLRAIDRFAKLRLADQHDLKPFAVAVQV